jgi:hypothetical protein
LKKEILNDDFKKRKIFWKIFRMGKFSMENFSPHITTNDDIVDNYLQDVTAECRSILLMYGHLKKRLKF